MPRLLAVCCFRCLLTPSDSGDPQCYVQDMLAMPRGSRFETRGAFDEACLASVILMFKAFYTRAKEDGCDSHNS